MLLLPLVMLGVLIPGGDNEHAFQGSTSFHLNQISSFVNSTWTQNRGSGWLDDLQIHGWDDESGTIIFLKPWSKGNLSIQEVINVDGLFCAYFMVFTRVVKDHFSQFQLTYPFEIQVIAGCELHSGKGTVGFLRGALGGLDFLTVKNGLCVPAAEGGNRARRFCSIVRQNHFISIITRNFLYKNCPQFVLGVLDAGKKELQKQVKPEAWLSSGPTPSPGRLLLVCHVSGFYPKPVMVMWMKGVQEQPGTHQGDLLPNADGTWYLRVTLEVAAGETANLNCRVKHSSLGGQDIVLYWEHSTSTRVIVLAVIFPILILLICLALWFWRRRSYQTIQ